MKLIDDKPIKIGDIIHMRYEIERYMKCHNSLVELYDMFVDNPTLSRFLDMAYPGTVADMEHPITPENFPKVFLMKAAIRLMAEYIENSESAYAFTLEEVSQNYDIDKEMLDYVISMNCGTGDPSVSDYSAAVMLNEYDAVHSRPVSIKITFKGKDHIVNINQSLYEDLKKLCVLKKRELDEGDKQEEDTVEFHKEPQETPTSRERHKVITLCGSTRFNDEFMKTASDLTRKGYIVLMPHIFSHDESEESDNQLTPEELLNMHLDRIDMSDEIFVINKDGYIGDGTKQEILYASEHGKVIRFLNVDPFRYKVPKFTDVVKHSTDERNDNNEQETEKEV